MKTVWLAAALLFALHTAASAVEPAEIDMSEPPFWVSSYDEFKDLSKEQKAFYIGKLGSAIKLIPSLKKMKKDDFLQASKDEEAWSEMRKKVYLYCADKTVVKNCESFAAIRKQALELGLSRKK
jgi:hypothetical protein